MKKLLSPNDKSAKKGSVFIGSITASVVMIICCAICLTGVTWAWFTANAAVKTADIKTADYKTELVVKDQDGNVIEPVDGKYNFENNVRYTATITASGTASTGFATFSVDGVNYSSIQLAPGESFSFDILGYSSLETGDSNWGTSTSQDPVFDGDLRFVKNAVNFYAFGEGTPLGEYDTDAPLDGSGYFDTGDSISLSDITAPEYANFTFKEWNTQADGEGTAYAAGDPITVPAEGINLYAIYDRVAVKLVPKDENSTAMIERDGVVETYNTALAATPYGVTEIKEPNAESYDAAGYETYYVYGLKVAAKVSELSDYVKVTGDGSYKVFNASGAEITDASMVGTGSVIKVYDNVTDEVVEEFYIVIFGDIDGDSIISAQDISRIKYELNHRSWSKPVSEGGVGYLYKAANLDLDAMISAQDIAKLSSANNKTAEIDQITGKAS